MMYSEFEERTGYQPDADEYRLIEESYYNFDGNKDEFCKEWMKWKKSGAWEREAHITKIFTACRDVQDAEIKELRQYREEANKTIGELGEKLQKSYDKQTAIYNEWVNNYNKEADRAEKAEAEVEALKLEVMKLKASLYDYMTK